MKTSEAIMISVLMIVILVIITFCMYGINDNTARIDALEQRGTVIDTVGLQKMVGKYHLYHRRLYGDDTTTADWSARFVGGGDKKHYYKDILQFEGWVPVDSDTCQRVGDLVYRYMNFMWQPKEIK
jgi:hypothetical protein